MLIVFVLMTLALVPASSAFGSDDDIEWVVRTARLEGASVNVVEAAHAVRTTADEIDQSGRLQRLAELESLTKELNWRVISAKMAAEQVVELQETTQPIPKPTGL